MLMNWMFQSKHGVADWIKKKKSLQYAAYKRLTLGQNTHINWRWGDGKYILCEWKWQESGSCNIHIRQNRL